MNWWMDPVSIVELVPSNRKQFHIKFIRSKTMFRKFIVHLSDMNRFSFIDLKQNMNFIAIKSINLGNSVIF